MRCFNRFQVFLQSLLRIHEELRNILVRLVCLSSITLMSTESLQFVRLVICRVLRTKKKLVRLRLSETS